MVEATAPPDQTACRRCGGPGTSIRGKRRGREYRGQVSRDRRRCVCVPCGRALGIVWTEFEQDTPGGVAPVRVRSA